MRSVWTAMLVAFALAGCSAAVNPVASPKFETKLINLESIASQLAAQQNMMPNAQSNFANQVVGSNANSFGAIASAVGTGAAAGVNATGQGLLNALAQIQPQAQLIL